MKTAALLTTCLLLGLSHTAQAIEVEGSISFSQPGVYGRVDIGRFPQPVLVQMHPVLIHRGPRALEPVYLWVPPGHQKNWRKHCGRYNACGVPVYFVQENWYQRHVGRDKRFQDDRGDYNDDRRDHKGHGHGHDKHGKGHGKGKD